MAERAGPIGVFDSGVGGLSVFLALRAQLPDEPLLYVADQAHVPYGSRPVEEVRGYAAGITRYMLGRGARVIVVACNTASAAALGHVRQAFPDVPFVGMEPAVKPAAHQTRTGVVGVLATPATFQGELYASLVDRFASGITVLQHTCPGLVRAIEAGLLQAQGTRAILEDALHPMLAQGMDTVVLGCTHYPFVIPLIEDIVGPEVRVIDPAPAVARQVGRVVAARFPSSQRPPHRPDVPLRFFTTGDPAGLADFLCRWMGESPPVGQLRWEANELVEA